MEVVAQRLAPSLISGGLSAATGSLLGNIGRSIDPFQQALDQARLANEFDPNNIVVSGSRIPQAGLGSVIAGGAPGALNLGTPAVDLLPGETLLESVGKRIPETKVSDGLAAAIGLPVDQMRKRIVQLEQGTIVRDQQRGMYGHTGH